MRRASRAFAACVLCLCSCAHADIMSQNIGSRAQADAVTPRQLVVGLADNHVPFSYKSPVYSTHVGFSVSLARELCAEMNASCTFEFFSSYELMHAVTMGRVNFSVADFSPGPTFENFVFSHGVIRAHPVIVSTDFGLNFSTVEDLRAYNFGVRFGTSAHAIMASERMRSRVAYYTIYSSYSELFDALERGDVDALYIDNLTAYGTLKLNRLKFYVCGDKFSDVGSGNFTEQALMMPTDDPALLYRLNLALDRIKMSGKLQKLSLEYFQYLDTGL